MKIRLIRRSDIETIKGFYESDEARNQMYAIPSKDEDIWRYFSENCKTFMVFQNDSEVAIFSLSKIDGGVGSFGIIVKAEYRGKGMGLEVMKMVEKEAKKMGIRTLRADVYIDNKASLRMLEKANFRPFVWLEKNLY